MKSFFEKYVIRQTGEQLASWSSLSKTVYLLLPLAVYYIINDVVEIACWALINRAPENVLAWASLYNGIITGVIYAVSAILILLCLRTMAWNEITFVSLKEKFAKSGFSMILIMILLGFSAALFLNLTANLTGFVKLSARYGKVYEEQTALHPLIGVLIYGLLSPAVEEVLFRGIIYNRMKRVFPIKISVVISSLLFGVFHADLVQGVYGFLMGLLITGIYEMSRNFLYPLILHITANTAVYVIMSRPAFTGLPQNVHIIITIVMFAITVTELFLLRRSYKNSGTDQT